MDSQLLASALVELLERSRQHLSAMIKKDLSDQHIDVSALIDQWLQDLVTFFNGGSGHVSEWLALLVDKSRRSGGNISDLYTIVRAVRRNVCIFAAGKIPGASEADIFNIIFQAEDQLLERIVKLYDENIAKLASAEKRRRKNIAEAARHAFILIDNDAVITLANSAFCKMMALPEDRLLGSNFLQLCEAKVAAELRRELRQRRTVSGRLIDGNLLLSGGSVAVKIRLLPLFDEDGLRDGLGLIMFPPGVGGAHLTMAAFIESIADSLGMSYCLVDRSGRVSAANQAAASFVELGREEDASYCCKKHLDANGACGRCFHERPFETGVPYRGSFQTRSASGQNRWLDMVCIPLRNDTGIVTHVAKLARDVTELRILEDQLLQQQKSNLMTQLAVAVAHQLRNPLGVMIGFADMLNRGMPPEQVPVAIEKILANGIRCKHVVENLLVLGKIAREDYRQVDLAQLLRDKVQPVYSGSNKKLQWSFDERATIVTCIPDQLALVLLHLIDLQAQSAESSVEVATTCTENGAMIDIRRDGPPLTSREQEALFAAPAPEVNMQDEIGLAVSLTRRIIESFGGSLKCDPEAPEKITLLVPAGEAGVPAKESVPPPKAEHAAKKRILIIEDEPDQTFLLQLALQSAGHDVDAATTTGEGIALLSQNAYDGIVIDILLGDGLGGRDIYQFICRFNPALTSRTMFITGDTMKYETRRFVQEVKRPVLEKPFMIADLVAQLNDIFEKPAKLAKTSA